MARDFMFNATEIISMEYLLIFISEFSLYIEQRRKADTLPAFAKLKCHDSLDWISAISYKDPCREIAICGENPLGTCFGQVDTKSSGAYFRFTPRLKKRSLYYFDQCLARGGVIKAIRNPRSLDENTTRCP